MITDFIIYTFYRCFNGYYYAISMLSILVVLIVSSLIKFSIQNIKPTLLNENLRSFFQLSIFLFIPVFAYLVIKKYKYNAFLKDELRVKNIPLIFCIVSVIFLISIDIFLFAYLLIF